MGSSPSSHPLIPLIFLRIAMPSSQPPPHDKQALKEELLHRMEQDLTTLERVHHETRAGATHEEAKSESDKDTRALEQTYLARGQAQRIVDLRAEVADVRNMVLRRGDGGGPVCLGALLHVEEDGEEQYLFMASHGGGWTLAGGDVHVITPKSPLGDALLGLRAGEECETFIANRNRDIYILDVW